MTEHEPEGREKQPGYGKMSRNSYPSSKQQPATSFPTEGYFQVLKSCSGSGVQGL